MYIHQRAYMMTERRLDPNRVSFQKNTGCLKQRSIATVEMLRHILSAIIIPHFFPALVDEDGVIVIFVVE